MIVVEGPDGAGKTTFVTRLLDAVPKLQLVPRAINSNMEVTTPLHEWTEEALRRGFGRHVYDRFNLVSEPIYGSLCRGELRPGFSGEWYDRAWSRFTSLNPVVIVCLPPKPVVVRNVDQDQPSKAKEHIKAIWDLYSVMAYQQGWLRWDYTIGSMPVFVNYIRTRVNGVSDH